MIPDTLIVKLADSIAVVGTTSQSLMVKMAAFKWLMYAIGFTGILARMLEKCPKNDWAGIKTYLTENVKSILIAALFYTGGYVLWSNAGSFIKEWTWAAPFYFLFNYKASAASFFFAYWILKLVRATERKLTDKGVLVDEPTPQP